MKPRFDHRIKRPLSYTTADETQQPGYLERRFRTLRAAARKAQEPPAPPPATAKVAPINKRRAA